MTLVPHKMHPSSTLTSALRLQNGLSWSSSCELHHPCNCSTNLYTRDKIGSTSVHLLMFDAFVIVADR